MRIDDFRKRPLRYAKLCHGTLKFSFPYLFCNQRKSACSGHVRCLIYTVIQSLINRCKVHRQSHSMPFKILVQRDKSMVKLFVTGNVDNREQTAFLHFFLQLIYPGKQLCTVCFQRRHTAVVLLAGLRLRKPLSQLLQLLPALIQPGKQLRPVCFQNADPLVQDGFHFVHAPGQVLQRLFGRLTAERILVPFLLQVRQPCVQAVQKPRQFPAVRQLFKQIFGP